jgi:hypothetical protein
VVAAGPCQCARPIYVEKVYAIGPLHFDDSYCGSCSKRWKRAKPLNAPSYLAQLPDFVGTSTSDDEAPLREIGRIAFGIEYPKDVTPRNRLG